MRQPAESHAIFPPFPLNATSLHQIDELPAGFRTLAMQRVLPEDIIRLLARITHASKRSANGNVYLPADKSPFQMTIRKYHTWSDASPCLLAEDGQVYHLLKPVLLALLVWCCNCYATVRPFDFGTSSFQHALVERLFRTGPTNVVPLQLSAIARDEDDCML
jgi:hypothetical protein